VHTGFCWDDLGEGNHLEGSGVEGKIILIWIVKKLDRGMGWIELSQDRDRWLGVVNAIMKLRVQ
jgi:hypothetical protein